MIELRWVKVTKHHNNTPYPAKELQYRYLTPVLTIDSATGAELQNGWSEWQTVPLVEATEPVT